MRLHTGRRPAAARRGSTLTEAALVLPLFLMFLFGVFEYGRYILVLQVSTNAAREGARWAVVHANDQRTADARFTPPADYTAYTPYTGPLVAGAEGPPTGPQYTVPFIENYMKDRMGGVDRMITGFAVRVFPCETAPLYATPCRITQKAASTSWNNSAFTERVAVKIVGVYRPILPGFLWMADDIPVSTVALMGSEG